MGDNKFGFGKVKSRIVDMKRALPIILANQAKNYFVKSWNDQGFDGKKWQEVQRRIPGTYAYEYPKTWGLKRRTAPILIGAGRVKGSSGGALRRAVATSIRTQQWNSIRLVVMLPYAAAHNDGTAKIPARPYMKRTATLNRMHITTIEKYTDKVWLV